MYYTAKYRDFIRKGKYPGLIVDSHYNSLSCYAYEVCIDDTDD